MLKHIRFIPLLIGIFIGIFGIYFIKPTKNVIYKYPTPDNSNNIVYKDKNDVCYKYIAKEVDCDKNESRLKDYPLST
jgi:hypothetical protein